jgi:hypothetical protein
MDKKVTTFVVEILPNGMRKIKYGDAFEAIELEDGGWLGFMNGLPVEMCPLLAVIWTICHSEDQRYPQPAYQGRSLFAGFAEEVLGAMTFRQMTEVVYRCARTIPDKNDEEPL